jgi:hypothetical protein
MAVSFDSIAFSVYPDGDGYLPLPAGPENANEPRTYTATARLQSGTDVSNLRAKRSIVTIQPAMGFVEGGTVVVEAGIGARSLTYPTAEAAELTEDAILTSIVPVGHLTNDDYRCELTVLLVG